MKTKVDFKYAFAEPHRLCICLPQASRKCLIDASKEGLTASWSDQDLTTVPLGALKPPLTEWWVDMRAEAGGVPMKGVSWKRIENRIPALEYKWENEHASIAIMAVSSEKADVFRFTASCKDAFEVSAAVTCSMLRNHTSNQIWIDPDSDANALLPTVGDCSDRMLVLVVGAPKPKNLPNRQSVVIGFKLKPGKKKSAFLIRPYKAIIDEAGKYLSKDWDAEIKKGLSAWKKLLSCAPVFSLPDTVVADSYYAGLADVFVMREKQSDGRVAHCPGTECYRSLGSGEGSIAAVVLDQAGFHRGSEEGMRASLGFQEKNGRWDDLRRWGHDMWGLVGIKCLAVREHYLFTKDRKYLAACFKRMLAHARWSEIQRKKIKVPYKGKKPLTWGLMPRGMGDCGLMDGNDLYGIFLPHNIWHYFVLTTALWAAGELGMKKEIAEIEVYRKDFHTCLLSSIEKGSIRENDGTRWIPGVPGKTTGSRFGVANAIYPCKVIEPFHPLATGTLSYLERSLSQGGLPINLGWMPGGLWVSIAIDNLSYAHLARGEEDKAEQYLYPTLNHGTPLFSWCEERMPEPGAAQVSGDRQHAWTPLAVSRFIRDALLMEDGDILHLCRATPRWWLEPGQEIKVTNAPTHWGRINFSVKRPEQDKLAVRIRLKGKRKPGQMILHCRIPATDRKIAVKNIKGGFAAVDDNKIVINPELNSIIINIMFL